jgi:diguanylate cyclase (GGDEF)-like protein
VEVPVVRYAINVTAPLIASLRSVSGVIDAIGLPVVVLDASGTVVDTNRAWRAHARMADGFESGVVAGASYLRVCERAAADGAAHARTVAAAVQQVLAGERELLEIEYPSRTATEERWVRVRALAGPGEPELGVVLVHQDITARKRLEQVVGGFEHHDPLTGLRSDGAIAEHLNQRLTEARRTGGRVGLTMVGVLGIDRIRAEVGVPAADELLIQVSGRIGRTVRGDDVLCRSGSDRFTLISKGLGANGFEALVDRLGSVLEEPYELAGRSVGLEVVVAGAISDPGSSASTLLAVARTRFEAAWEAIPPERRGAMPEDRPDTEAVVVDFPLDRSGPGTSREPTADEDRPDGEAAEAVALPDPQRREEARADRALGAALDAGTIGVAYRPVVRFHDRVVCGAIAEPFAPDPGGDHVRGAPLAAAAQRTGAEAVLGWAVAGRAISDAAAWQRSRPEASLRVLVPVGPALFSDPALVDRLGELVAEAGLAPSRVVAVVGADAIADLEQGQQQLARLAMAGLQVCIDDFGRTPFSMLELSQLPVDTVRIDVPALGGAHGGGEVAVIAAVLAAADALGLRVVAAGLGIEAMAREVRRLGCSYGEGPAWPGADDGERFLELVAEGPLPPADDRGAPVAARPRAAAGGARASGTGGSEELDLVFRAIVHEVRTPLTVAMGYASLLELSADPESARAARSIRRAAERINRQLGSLEDVRMMDQGALQLDQRDLDLRALVRDTCAELHEVMGLDVVVRPPAEGQPGVVPVSVDELRIGQVVINLVTNAAKYTSRGTPVEVRLWVEDGWVEVAVVDDGPGVPIEQAGQIFRKYARADSTRPGSGLGLYLARGIARAHGGDVTYRRRSLRPGSAFTLRLPLATTTG